MFVNIDISTTIPIAYFVQGSHLVVRRHGPLENCDRAMKINIKISTSLTDEAFDVLASPHDTIDDFELLIEEKKGIAPWSQTLTHNGENINGNNPFYSFSYLHVLTEVRLWEVRPCEARNSWNKSCPFRSL